MFKLIKKKGKIYHFLHKWTHRQGIKVSTSPSFLRSYFCKFQYIQTQRSCDFLWKQWIS